MELNRRSPAGHEGPSHFRFGISIAMAALLAAGVTLPSQFALAGVAGAGVLGQPISRDNTLVTKVGQGNGQKKGKGGNAQVRRGPQGNVVVRAPGGNQGAFVVKGQKKNVYVNRTVVNRTVVNRNVVVVRPVRGWYRRPYYGNFVSGVALGTILGVAAVGIAPIAPAPNLCWYWSDPAMINGYWDYCY
jgi:hypothetical protein